MKSKSVEETTVDYSVIDYVDEYSDEYAAHNRDLVKRSVPRNDEQKKEEKTAIFFRLVELWKKMMKSSSLNIEYAYSSNQKAFVLKDSESIYNLGLIYTPPSEIGSYSGYNDYKELILDYGGIKETITKENVTEFEDMLKILEMMAKEQRFAALEEEINKR